MHKIKLHSETLYFLATVLLALAVAMLTAADFGVSMIVAPAYILSLKTGFLTFGQAEYVLQACLFLVFCLIMRRFKTVYLASFATCLIYGAVLDAWRLLPVFNPHITPPGSMAMPLRIFFFVFGILLTSVSIACFFKTYLYPQVYDFFVKGVSAKFHIKRPLFKTCFDLACLAVGSAMTLLFFGKFVGISFGTLFMALINGSLIGFFGKLLDKGLSVKPFFPKFAAHFSLEEDPLKAPLCL